MTINNKNSFTYRKYRKNIKDIFKKSIVFLVLFFVFLYIVLNFFSVLLNPRIFTVIFLIFLFVFMVFNRLLDKKITKFLKYNYLTWGRGAGAELVVMRSLGSLGEKYKIIDDIQNGKGNVDLVCVGPTGIFVVEVKSQSGFISWNNELLRNAKPLDKDFIKQTQAEKYSIKNYLKEELDKEYKVQGILEFANAKTDNSIRGQKNGIWIGGRGFARWVILKKGVENLSNGETEKIYNLLFELKEKNK